MRTLGLVRWLHPMWVAAGMLLAEPLAHAGGHGGGQDAYGRAAEQLGDERFDEAAAGFVAAYNEGFREGTSAYNAACSFARGQRKDQAFQWLEKAYQAGFELEGYLDDDSDLRSLRSDPRFANLRQRVMGGRVSAHEREGQRLVQRYDAMRASDEVKGEKYDSIGRELLGAGRYGEAAGAFLRAATATDAAATSLYNAACARALAGQTEAALAMLQAAVEEGFSDVNHLDEDDDLDSIRNDPRFAGIRALAEELDTPPFPSQLRDRDSDSQREWQRALPRLAATVRNHPRVGQAWANLGLAYIAIGRGELAIQPFEQAVVLGYKVTSSAYNAACAHAIAGHVDAAFVWLDRALASGFTDHALIGQDEDLANLRGDPRFRRYGNMARLEKDGVSL